MTTLSRRRLLRLTGAGFAVAAGTQALTAGPAAAAGRPNVVIVLADDLGYGEVGCYGQRLIRTPRLDRLAAEGIRFTDAYAGGPVCAPSRCSLLTGLHSGHSAVRTNPLVGNVEIPLSRYEPTLATVLKGAGYRTACIGKWGMGIHPFDADFDEFFGYLTHREAHDYFPPHLWDGRTKVSYPDNVGGNVTYAPAQLLARARKFLADAGDQPFCLLYTPNLPHGPGEVPNHTPYQDEDWPNPQKAHAAQVTRLDGQVGALVDTLRAEGLDRNTLVLFISDNGPHEEGFNPDFFDANGPLRGYKRNLYEGGVRVPMIAWGAGVLGAELAGTVRSGIVAFWDVLPTLAELCGAEIPADLDGVSVRHLLTGGPATGIHPPLYWQRLDTGITPRANAADAGRAGRLCEAVRAGDWKLVRFAPGRDRYAPDELWDVELYDLAADGAETTTVAAVHPDVVARLLAQLRAAYREPPWVRRVWRPGGLTAVLPPAGVIGAGQEAVLRTVFADPEATDVQVTLTVPSGWTAEPIDRAVAHELGRDRPLRTRWRLRAPAGITQGPPELVASAQFTTGGTARTLTLPMGVRVVPPAPATTSYLSDLPWDSTINGLGPVERDASNGAAGAGDGGPISLAGVRYAKGLGCHSPARIGYHLGGVCRRFTATVGVDDSAAATAEAVIAIIADGAVIHRGGLLTRGRPVTVDVDVSGRHMLELVAGDVRAPGCEPVSWADAKVAH